MPAANPGPRPKPRPLPLHPARWRDALLQAGLPVVALLVLVVAGLLWLAWRVLDPTPAKHLVIATGPEQGAYEAFASRYLPLLQAQGLTVELRRTQGAAENLALLRDPGSGVQVAFVQGGVDEADTDDAAAVPLAALGSVAVEPLWLFYRSDSLERLAVLPAARPAGPARAGRPVAPQQIRTPDNLSQLAGWRIDVGPAGGGSAPLFRQLAAANGLPADHLVAGDGAAVNRVVALVQGQVDALALVSAPDAPLLQYLLSTPGVRLFDFAQAEAYARRFPFLRPLVLPRGVIDLASDLPPRDLRLVASNATLVARADLHPALVQLLLQAAHQAHGAAGWFNQAGEFPNAQVAGWALAPEADRYHRSGPPWLQRYLPFWLANFGDRMWIVLLPLLAALVPLSRIVPPLVTLRLRSRVYRWYANLRSVEQALEQPEPDLAQLHAELERIDAQTEHIGLPLSFTNELYDLRAHIHLVRKRLLARGDGSAGGADARPQASQPAAS
jgi:TRAP-type uncharacterized transport system substrate-binding protein